MADKKLTFGDLAEMGEGVLVKRGDVWTYPGAETDRSGTNVQLPIDYVSDAEVQQALRDGDVVPVTVAVGGGVLSVRLKGEGDVVAAISVAQAGSPEAGTELPLNSRVEHDAGMKPLPAAVAPAPKKPAKADAGKVEGAAKAEGSETTAGAGAGSAK